MHQPSNVLQQIVLFKKHLFHGYLQRERNILRKAVIRSRMLFVNSFQTVRACVKQLRESDSWCCLWCMATSPLREGGSTTWNATSAYSRGWKNWISSLELNLFPCFSFFFEMFLDDFHESWRNFDAKEFCQPVQDNGSHPCGNLCHWRIVVMTFEGQACCYQRETNLLK